VGIDLIDRSDVRLVALSPEQLAAIVEIERKIHPILEGSQFLLAIHALVDLAVQGAGLSNPPMPEGYLHNLIAERFTEYRKRAAAQQSSLIIPVGRPS
jgi:hypothetical protein